MVEFEIEAPMIARKVLAGQFVVIKISESGERIPLTVAEKNTEKGTITIVVLGVGKTTAVLAEMEEGDEVMDLVGPLGRPSEIRGFWGGRHNRRRCGHCAYLSNCKIIKSFW